MWREVAHCIEQVRDMVPDAVVGIIGARIWTKRE
jgi:hypothetical protein